jgi:chromosome segregation ATPase
LGQIQNLNLQKAEIERAYNEELRKHELTRVALDKKMAECTQKDAEIQHQIRIIQAELATTKGLLMEKEKEITTIKMSKSGQNSIVAQQLARKEQDLLALHANIQLLTTQLSACESSSQLASTYLAEINVLKRTIQDLQNPQSNIRFQRNFPGSSQTQRRNERRNNFKTKKLTFGSNWNTPSQPSQSSQPIRSAIEMAANREGLAQRLTPGLTEKNFPGLVKIRNNAATSKLSRINRERQEWQKTNPQRNLYIGGTRKNGKPYNTNSTLTILPSASNRKGARMAKSKRNIHPLK